MTENSDKVIVMGWLPDGRPIQIEYAAFGELDKDIPYSQHIAAKMTDAGISPRPIDPDMEEKSETVHYVLRTETENEHGISQKLYLYTERFTFKFLHVYLNNDAMIADFERAFGFSPLQLPHYEGEAAFERGKKPDKERQFLVKLTHPVQVFYKRNPRWSEDLSEEDKKKVQKNIFVRWGASIAPTAENSTPQHPAVRTPQDPPAPPRRVPASNPAWDTTFQALMQHGDVERAYPQQNHRAAAIQKLHQLKVFEPCPDVNGMAYRICAYQAFRVAGKSQEDAVAEVLATETFDF